VTTAGTLVGIGIVAALLSTPSSVPVQPPHLGRAGPGQGHTGRVARPVRQPVPRWLTGWLSELWAERDRQQSGSTGASPTTTPGPSESAPTTTVPPTTSPGPATTTP